MHPKAPTAPPGQVPPGAIGHNRGVVGGNFAFFPPEGVLKSRLPAWSATSAHFLAAPALGAGFSQVMLAIEPGGGTAAPIQLGPQHFLYLVEGTVEVAIGDDAPVALTEGGFAYVPPETRFTARNQGAGLARLMVLKKRYEMAEGLAVPDPIIAQHQAMPMTNHTGLEGRGFKHLLPFGDMRFDFEMNMMMFQPGTSFPAVETHIMEHGLLMLEGQGLYFLSGTWHEIWAGDFIWMGAYCPQQFYPTGQGQAVYLLYKNVNRDVAL